MAAAAVLACLCAPASRAQDGLRAPPPTPAADWSRPLTGLGALRADLDGDFVPDRAGEEVLVAGRVSAGVGLVRADLPEIYLQDGTGGVRVLLGRGSPPVLAGDSVLVHGIAGHRLGMLELVAPNVRVVAGPPRRPALQRLGLATTAKGGQGLDLENHEGELVEIEGSVLEVHADTAAAGRQLVLLAGTSLVSVFAYRTRAQPITFAGIAPGDYVRVRGVAVQHDPVPPYNGSYVVYPLDARDVERVGVPPGVVRQVALGAGALLLGALLWAALLRAQVRRRTRELVASETRFSHVFDAAADPVLVLDLARPGLVVQANRAAQRAFGVAPDGHVAATVGTVERHLLLGEIASDPEEALHHLADAADRGAATAVLELRRGDGHTAPFELATRRLRTDDAEPVLVAVARDVEERRAYEHGLLVAMQRSEEAREAADAAREAAEEANRLKATILANMSHELRTPLTGILGFADILREEVAPDLVEYADTIKHGGERLLNTLNDLFELSQLDGGAADRFVEPFDAVAAVQRAASAYAAEAQAAGLAFTVSSDAADARVVQSPAGLARVTGVLVGNAVKFTERGSVRVTLHTAPDFIALRVQDTGVGIRADFLPRLYEPFTQESGGHARAFEGNGLGLAIAKRHAERMGGDLRVWSRPGEGTLFEAAFPRVAPGADAALAAAALADPSWAAPGATAPASEAPS